MQEIPAYEYSKAAGSRCQVTLNGPSGLFPAPFLVATNWTDSAEMSPQLYARQDHRYNGFQ